MLYSISILASLASMGCNVNRPARPSEISPNVAATESVNARPLGLPGPVLQAASTPPPTQGIIYVSPKGVAITDSTLSVQGTSQDVGSFNNLFGSTVEDVIARIPTNWTWAPQNKGQGIKFIDDVGIERIRMHGPSQGAPPGSNSRAGWILRIMDQQGNYYDHLGNISTNHANNSHIPLQGNPNIP